MRSIVQLLIIFVMVIAISACSSDNNGGGGSKGNNSSDENPTGGGETVTELDLDDIQNNDYELKVALDFLDSDEQIINKFEGTNLEHKVKHFNLYYAYQKRITETEFYTLDQACTLLVEASESTTKSDVYFQPGNLRFVQIQHYKQNSDFEVTVVLQAAVFQQFWISCKNTPDSEAIKTHVGHLLNLSVN